MEVATSWKVAEQCLIEDLRQRPSKLEMLHVWVAARARPAPPAGYPSTQFMEQQMPAAWVYESFLDSKMSLTGSFCNFLAPNAAQGSFMVST